MSKQVTYKPTAKDWRDLGKNYAAGSQEWFICYYLGGLVTLKEVTEAGHLRALTNFQTKFLPGLQ